MNRYDVYKWLKELKGMVTIGEFIYEFSEVDPVEVAAGLNMYVSQAGQTQCTFN